MVLAELTEPVGGVYALLADGTTVEIRPAAPPDFDAIKAMHEAMSPANSYLRFFSMSRTVAEREAGRLTREPAPDHAALLALASGQLVGTASYEVAHKPAPRDAGHDGGVPELGDTAEIAFAVADGMHQRGIATLLLEHLVSLARAQQLRAFTAETLSENTPMLRVFSDAGLPATRHREGSVVMITIPLPPDDTGTELDAYLDTVARREQSASVASLRHVFAPESVVVIGTGRRPGGVGRSVVDNILTGGYEGRLYAVNPQARQIGGVPCFTGVADLPEAPDLAVIAVPPPGVLGVAEACGVLGVRGLVVLTAGLETTQSADLLAVCRRHGMRLIGPNCFGIAVPAIGLDATFSATRPVPGVAGLVMQSGGLGFAMVDQLTRLGIGISSFASVGDKLDVSSNDMLLWWEQDGVTRLAVLYIESFGNPRKFARTARRVSAAMPVLTVLADRAGLTDPGTTAREALFEQAGVVATRGFGELIQATALLATQPAPAGRAVAIVSNVGSAATLAADACADLGLTVQSVTATATPVSAGVFRECLERQAASGEADAIVAIVLPTGATGDLAAAITAADTHGLPVVAVVLTQPESVRMLAAPGGHGRRIPAYGGPEIAVRALARAAAYGAWRAEPRGRVPRFPDVRTDDARALVQAALLADPVWLDPEEAATLLRCYGLPLADLPPAGTELTVRVTDDHMFGSLVTLCPLGSGPGAARLTPLTDRDAAKLAAAAGQPGLAAHAPLADLLLRVGRLADELPEVTELELSPVAVGPDEVAVVNARVQVSPYQPQDPFLRKLR